MKYAKQQQEADFSDSFCGRFNLFQPCEIFLGVKQQQVAQHSHDGLRDQNELFLQ